jgi:hypothetical protein
VAAMAALPLGGGHCSVAEWGASHYAASFRDLCHDIGETEYRDEGVTVCAALWAVVSGHSPVARRW